MRRKKNKIIRTKKLNLKSGWFLSMFAMLATYSWSQRVIVSMDTVGVEEVFFDQIVEDPYRYFENRNDSKVKEYSNLLDNQTEDYFQSLASSKRYRRYLEKIDNGVNDEIGEVKISETGSYFYLKMAKRDYSWKIYYRSSISEPEKLLFNPEKFSGKSKNDYEITAFEPSWDGSKVIIGISPEHSHTSEIIILDIKTGEIQETGIENSRPDEYYGMNWTPSGDSFTYTSLSVIDPTDPKVKLNTSLSLYSLKKKQSRIVFGNGIEPSTDNRLFPITQITSSKDQYIIVYTAGPSNYWDSYYTTFDDLKNSSPSWKKLLSIKDNAYEAKGKLHGDKYYFISEMNNSKAAIVAIKLEDETRQKEKIVEIESELITDFLLAENKIYFTTSKYGASASLFIVEGKKSEIIDLPLKASKIKITSNANNSIWIDAKSPLNEVKHFSYKMGTELEEEHLYIPGNYPMFKDFSFDLVEVKSHDGQMVPMSIIHRKDIVLNGNNPVFSYSYGAFGANDNISFQTHLLSFVSLGGVLVFPHIRGGGAKGKQWHEAGKKETKYNSWKDLIECMNYLVEKKYTQHSKITLFAESAGAISTAMAVNENPNIAGGLIIGSGVLNPYRKESVYKSTGFLEYGTMKDSTEALALIAMDPYLNITRKTVFPSTLVLHGLRDDRIYLHEPLKYVARMQKNNTGPNPILLDLDKKGTHNSVTDFYEYFGRIFSFAFSESKHEIGI